MQEGGRALNTDSFTATKSESMQGGWSGANLFCETNPRVQLRPACSGGGRALTDGESGLASAAAAAGAPTINPCVSSWVVEIIC